METPSQIADELMILRQSMTNILDALEKRGLVCREIDPGDRRRIRVQLLPEGETAGKDDTRGHQSDLFHIKKVL